MPHFKKLREVGSGTYGKALLVKDIYGKEYIMKIIELSKLDYNAKKAAQNEAEVLASLGTHPFIIQYHKSYVQGTKLYIMMDFAKGGDLYKKITQQRSKDYFPESTIIRWSAQAFLAVEFLHKRHILHRDLKTQNIFLGERNQLLIGDFGVSKILNSSIDFTETKIGTPYYISPELCKGRSYSYPADIWALGCILYELITLYRPFEGRSIGEVINSIQYHSVPPIPSHYSSELNQICQMMLTKDPRQRPSIDELLNIRIIRAEVEKIYAEERRSNLFSL